MTTRIQLRRDTAANWTSVNPVLAAGEKGIETDTGKEKTGMGAAWNSTGYFGGGVSIGTVSGTAADAAVTATAIAGAVTTAAAAAAAASKSADTITNGSTNVSMLATERTKLAGVAAGATANTVGTASGTVAAGDDSRIIGATQKANNLSDVADTGSARANIHVPMLSSAAAVAVANVATLSGNAPLDGYTPAATDIVLLVGQTTASQNGPWLIPTGGGAWTRPTDFASGATVHGRLCHVMNGTLYGGTVWALTTPTAGIVIDTTGETWHLASSSLLAPLVLPVTPGNALTTQSGNTLDDGSSNMTVAGLITALGGIALPAGSFLSTPAQSRAQFLKPAAALYESVERVGGGAFGNQAVLATQRPYLVAIGLPSGLSIGSIAFVSGSTAIATPVDWWFGLLDSNQVQLAATGDALTTAWAATTCQQLPLASNAGAAAVTTTVGSASNAVNVNSFTTASPGTLTVASTTGFASTGVLGVSTSTGIAMVVYTGVTATTFTGCQVVTVTAGVAVGTLATGGTVWQKKNFTTTYSGLYYLEIVVNATTVPSLEGLAVTSAVTGIVPKLYGQSADTAITTPPAYPHTAGAISASAPIYCFVGA